ncbi:MAG: phage holin family protein [Eubacteriales bacterium]|nr:phage holin family protein [Eubacteriales bacterium]MDD3882389.1 phage holin family protein [Eubacteriales bacterium]MDD4512390.1 phage holin family protein [Eubacteriales bacterium]
MSKIVFRFAGTIVGMTAALYFLPGLQMPLAENGAFDLIGALICGLELAVFYLIFRPIFRLLFKPLSILTLGLFSIVLDAIIIFTMPYYFNTLTVGSYTDALLAALIVSLGRALFSAIAAKLEG